MSDVRSSAKPAFPPPAHPTGHRPIVVALALAGVFTAALLAVLVTGAEVARAAQDQANYHLPAIEQFARTLPEPDISNYSSATSPGYHLVLAVFHRYVSADLRLLRAAGAIFTVILLAVLGYAAGVRVSVGTGIAIAAPMVASLYVFTSGAWLLPDNAGWLTVLAMLILAYNGLSRPRDYVLAAGALFAAVLFRQTNIWPAGLLALSAALADRNVAATEGPRFAPVLRSGWVARAALVLVATLPAVGVLAWFFSMWHGLTPPAFQTVNGALPVGHSGWQHEGPNFAVPAMALAVLGCAGAFYAGYVWRTITALFTQARGRSLTVVLAGAALGALSGAAVPTSWNMAEGRYSGLWSAARQLPVVGERSLFIIGLAAVGGVVLAVGFLALPTRDRWIWLGAWICFIAAQTANAMAWQRYYEPFCLMMLPLAAARLAARPAEPPPPRWAAAGPVLLAALLGGVTLSTLTRG